MVKTAASHAVNIGSNPVWVTKTPKPYGLGVFLSNESFWGIDHVEVVRDKEAGDARFLPHIDTTRDTGYDFSIV